jgi:hypothetical protein
VCCGRLLGVEFVNGCLNVCCCNAASSDVGNVGSREAGIGFGDVSNLSKD